MANSPAEVQLGMWSVWQGNRKPLGLLLSSLLEDERYTTQRELPYRGAPSNPQNWRPYANPHSRIKVKKHQMETRRRGISNRKNLIKSAAERGKTQQDVDLWVAFKNLSRCWNNVKGTFIEMEVEIYITVKFSFSWYDNISNHHEWFSYFKLTFLFHIYFILLFSFLHE